MSKKKLDTKQSRTLKRRQAINKAKLMLGLETNNIVDIAKKIAERQGFDIPGFTESEIDGVISDYTGVKFEHLPTDPVYKRVVQQSKPRKKKKDFFSDKKWRNLRYKALNKYGRRCACCGRMPPDIVLHVDHIKPRSLFPELELDIENLQILCEDCNLGKSNKDCNDYR